MKRVATLAACLLLTCSLAAQDKGYWKASSTTARGVTGDIRFAGEKLIINFASFTIAEVRTAQPTEVQSVFDGSNADVGHLYRLSIPATQAFNHKNTLCGAEETQYMLTAVDGKSLQVAFFSGSKMPDLNREAILKSTNLCGTYTYSH